MSTVEKFQSEISELIASAVVELGGAEFGASDVSLSAVPENAPGDVAFSCFALRGKLAALDDKSRNNPAVIASRLAEILGKSPVFESVVAAGPYVNMTYDAANLSRIVVGEILARGTEFGSLEPKNERIVVEFSAPNTNKPQHLGHLRNNVIGESVSRLLKKSGYDVVKVNIINDRGIFANRCCRICSMATG